MAKKVMFPNGIKAVSTTIPIEDAKYCAKHKLMYSHLLRGAIRDHRVHTNDPDSNPSLREMKDKLQRVLSRLQEARDFMEQQGILNKFLGIK